MSTRITTGMVQRNVLSDLHAVNAKLTQTQMKVASNREINRPSDDPFNASRALALRDELDSTRQLQRNAHDGLGWQEATEQALNRITEIIHSAKEVLVQGGSDTAPQSARDAIAEEIDELTASLKQYGNTTYLGRHLFAGTATQTKPYPDGSDVYAGDAGTIPRQIGPSVSLQINVLGAEVLGSGQAAGDDRLIDVMRDIAQHLRAGDGPSLRGTDLSRLEANLDKVLEVRALNGARTNRLESAVSRLAEVEEVTVSQLSETEDADLGKTLIDLNSQQAAYQAALRAGANIMQSSLMDFLR